MTPRLLYLDDNPSNVKLMRMLLSLRAEVRLSVARDGAEGLSLALAEPPDLVLVDLYLPDMRGDEVVRRLKAEERTPGAPCVIMSAETDETVIRDAMRSGAVAFIPKPFDVEELLRTIEDLLPGFVSHKSS
ncbi:MAG: response regulator [Actinomycetota bacterium]|nr:response regulator [Actinomycetota bacterium]